MLLDGRPVMIGAPSDALRPNIGIGLVPEDRKSEALFLNLSGKHNVSLPVIERFTRGGLIDKTREAAAVSRVLSRVEVERRALWTRRVRVLRRQSAEDRDRQMAAGREPHPATVRSNPRHRRRHQA